MTARTPQTSWLTRCLERIPAAKIAVFGDFCVDAYWLIEPDESELSVETGRPVRRVRQQCYSLGGAGNIIANLVDLGVTSVEAIGLVGDDLFGRQLLDMLRARRVGLEGMLSGQADWQTLVYAKPCIGEVEQNRVDFGAFNVIAPAMVEALALRLDQVARNAGVVILNQQVLAGVSSPAMIQRINEVVSRHPGCRFLADSRHRAELYRGTMLKLNTHEAARLLSDPRPLAESIATSTACALARRLFEHTGKTVFMTRGEEGILLADEKGIQEVPGIQVLECTDPVGAGDTALASLAAVLASGGEALEAARLANIAASITVRKLQTTGTASPREILDVGPEPDYIYLPELAADPEQARYAGGPDSEIEVVRDLPAGLDIRHAIFDHDGTISTLREGWEQIMEPMMVRAILGRHYDKADMALYQAVVERVRRYIDKTTGVQTLVQMRGLVEMVRQFHCVPESEILDMHGYKALYNQALLESVTQRLEKLKHGELEVSGFVVENAVRMLEHLHGRGVRLYLVSGTDQTDVVAEAQALGYGRLFEGRIFGAVGDVRQEAKRDVLERIIRANGLSGAELATFGDGPVEMREARKAGGLAVGVASDEVRGFGLNRVKRARLIRAGADLIVSDFSQWERLLQLLGLR